MRLARAHVEVLELLSDGYCEQQDLGHRVDSGTDENEVFQVISQCLLRQTGGGGLCKVKQVPKIRDYFGSGWVVGSRFYWGKGIFASNPHVHFFKIP